jgi:hypothetical protein
MQSKLRKIVMNAANQESIMGSVIALDPKLVLGLMVAQMRHRDLRMFTYGNQSI